MNHKILLSIIPLAFVLGFTLGNLDNADARFAGNPVIFFYDSIEQKKTIIELQESLGLTLLHDDFVDGRGNPTNGNSGKLTFDTYIPDSKTSRETLFDVTKEQIRTKSATADQIMDYLILRDNLDLG